MKIFIVNGLPGSGKTTFEEIFSKYAKVHGKKTKIVSTIDVIKEKAKLIGWDGEKDAKGRKLLSDLKDILTEYNDLSFKTVTNVVKMQKDNGITDFFFIDSREPEDIERLKKELGAETILISRKILEKEKQSNHADTNVSLCEYDYIIHNDLDIGMLKESAEFFYDYIERN